MFRWLEEYYRIRREHIESLRHCESCDVLRAELATERNEKRMLLQHIITPKDWSEPVQSIDSNPMPILKGHKPWRVRQQELELEDKKQHSRIMQEFRARVDPAKTAELEKEMGIGNGEKITS